MNTGRCLLLSAGIVALSTGWVAAAPTVTRDFISLRSGPGFKFRVVEVIPPGSLVDARNCSVGWCQVNTNGVIGYVDSGYLDFSASSPIVYTVGKKAPWPYGAYSSAFVSYWRNPYGYYYRLNLLSALPPARQECVAARPPIP